jgi:hypothetical protein
MNAYPITQESKSNELQIIRSALQDNHYYQHIIHQTHEQKLNSTTRSSPQIQKSKWANFTYSGIDTRIITKIFKNRNVKI